MELTFDVIYTTKTRPASIPAHMLILNAPRPLYGEQFNGEFLEGVHYAAIDPADSLAAQFADENRRLRAVLVEYVGMETAREWFAAYFIEAGCEGEEFTDREIWNMYTAVNELPCTRTITFA